MNYWPVYELTPSFDSSLCDTVRVKPMNTKTRKTMWKERRRRANLPSGIRKRLQKAA